MAKVVIIGASIGGAALAFLLSKKVEVSVHELKPRSEIGKKLCSNICTEPIAKMLYDWGFNPEEFIKTHFTKVKISTREKSVEFPINEFEIDRMKLVDTLISAAEKNGAKFHFSSKFVDFHKEGEKFNALFDHDGKRNSEIADSIVGADGAVSEFARKIGLWNKRKHFLYLQGKVERDRVRPEFVPDEHTQHVFVGSWFGYYSYVYPTEGILSLGLGDELGEKDIRSMFNVYLDYLGVKKVDLQGALIPIPQVVGMKKGLFLIGDAACDTKFSLGGIIPALMAAEAVRDIILHKKYARYKALKRKVKIHEMATRVLRKLNDKDYEELFEIMKKEKYQNLVANRDRFNKKDLMTLASPELALFSLKRLLRRK